MADFTPVALGVKPPQGMSLGEMLNFAQNAQQYQQAQQLNPLALQKAQMEIEQAQKINPLVFQKAQEDVKQAQIGTNKAQLENMLQHTNTAVQGIQTLLSDKDLSADKIKNHVSELITNAGGPESAVKQALFGLPENGTQTELRAYLAKKLATGMSTQAQLEKLYPQAQMLNTGNQQVPVGMGNQMLTGVAPGTPQGLGIETQLPPTTEAVAVEGDGTGLPPGTRYIVGPQSQQTQNKPRLATALSPAATSANAVTSSDWEATQKAATQAQPRIAIFQNIKKFAPDAFTGTGGARKELAAGILNAVGISAYEAEKVSTEELAKNSALLAMAGGNTDAARALAEIANPNKKLNENAIKEISNQMIGIEKMNQAKAQFLAPVAQDSAKYQEKLNVFNQVADPRLFQEATPEDVARMKARMSKAEIADFGNRVKLLKQMGLTQ